MSNFETRHYFIIEKEEFGVVFAKCIRHKIPEYGVGIRKREYIDMLYIGIDKDYAEDLYSTLVSKYKQISQSPSKA